MKFLSPAKLNLNLKVISKRIDVYHNLETTFQFIDLFDEITFEKSNESFNISCDGLEIEPENNLIFKSFNAIKEYCEADEVIFMDEGMIVEKNTTKEFFANPKSDRTKLFLSR